MKKTIPLFFAFLLALNSFRILFFYGGGILFCKIQAEKEIITFQYNASKKFIEFSSANKNLKLISDKEISVSDKMFDVVKTEKHGEEIIYFAYSDEKEDNYLSEVSQFEKNNSNSNSPPTKNAAPEILKYVSGKKVFDLNSILSNQLFFSNNLLSEVFFYQSPFRNIFSPPPEVFIS